MGANGQIKETFQEMPKAFTYLNKALWQINYNSGLLGAMEEMGTLMQRYQMQVLDEWTSQHMTYCTLEIMFLCTALWCVKVLYK